MKFDEAVKEYTLVDARAENARNPRTFLIPDNKDIVALLAGSTVKLIFVFSEPKDEQPRAERLWVEIESTDGENFKGRLKNDPCYLKTVARGDSIEFTAKNIASVYDGKSRSDEGMLCVITRKALENRQIGWAARTDEKHDIHDSGWQFFFGDESQKYLENPANSTLVRITDVLVFEPLLEAVLCGRGKAYEYSEEQNKFIEA